MVFQYVKGCHKKDSDRLVLITGGRAKNNRLTFLQRRFMLDTRGKGGNLSN